MERFFTRMARLGRAITLLSAAALVLALAACSNPSGGEDPVKYTITFDSQGGTTAQAITADAGTAVEKPADPARNGYTFEGWYSAARGGNLYTWPHTLTADVTMYARWTPITYTITYNLDGGANPEAPPTSYTVESAEIKLPTPTKKPSYSFGGWFDNSGFAGTALTSIARGSTGDKTLWVKWNETGLMGTISYWVNEQGQISSTGSPATVSKTGNPLTITADGAGYSDQHWSINGVEDVSAAGQASYDFSGADKDTKTYTVGLRVKKDNQYYAVQFAVTVTD